MRKRGESSPAEVRRLKRLGELARASRRAERALLRAILAAHSRGISIRKIAAAAGIPSSIVGRTVLVHRRPENGQGQAASKPAQPANRATKPKEGGK